MFGFTCLGWLLFRETNGPALWGHLTRDPFAASPAQWVTTVSMLGICALGATPLLLALAAQRWLLPRLERSTWYLPIQTTLWAAFACSFFFFGRMSAMDFIYFQF